MLPFIISRYGEGALVEKWLDFSNIDDSWVIEKSGEMEQVNLYPGRAELTAGGYDAFTHYARIRQVSLTIPLDFPFTVESMVEFPDDFYTQQTDYFRLLGVDNYPIAIDGHTWRIGLVIYSDHKPRIELTHKGIIAQVIWTGERFPTGKHCYAMSVNASKIDPTIRVYVDGKEIGSTNAANVPDLDPSEAFIKRQAFGIDGAAGYDNSQLSLTVFRCGVYDGYVREGCLGFFMRVRQ